MKASSWARVRELFHAVVELPPEERRELLDVRFGRDPEDAEVRQELERLLAEDERSRDAPDLEPLRPVPARPTPALRGGQRIGRYEITRAIAAGGMGTVYEAVQDEPHRRVAVKTLRVGLRTPEERRRFQFEVEVLGRLRHAGIARIHEAGTHGEGEAETPFFAMELVEGARDLLTYARQEELPIGSRLALFLELCDAVQHGHQQGVVHRDLKPDNVLVDAEGRVVVIDFGVARLLDSESERWTQPGRILGTVLYMSPEQLSGDPDAVDTRADVYALGALLHELLAGSPILDLRGLSVPEMIRRAAEDAPRPLSEAAPELAGDLEWIVVRALEKDKERRYPSVSELASDVRRHLADEPVAAGPPTATYRLAKLLRRNRALVGAVLGVIAALAVGLGWALVERGRALRARADESVQREVALDRAREAEEARRLAERARTAEREQRETAEAALERADRRARLAIMGELFLDDMLDRLDPSVSGGREVTVREVFEATLATLDRMTDDGEAWPPAIAEFRESVAETYLRIGDPAAAEEQARLSYEVRLLELGPAHEETQKSLRLLIHALFRQDEIEEVGPYAREAYAVAVRSEGVESDAAMDAADMLGRYLLETGELGEAEVLFREAVDRRRPALDADPGHRRLVGLLNSLGHLALVLHAKGELEEAAFWAREELALAAERFPPHDNARLEAEARLGRILWAGGELDEARPLLEHAFEQRLAVFGPADTRTVVAAEHFLDFLEGTGDAEGAARFRAQYLADPEER